MQRDMDVVIAILQQLSQVPSNLSTYTYIWPHEHKSHAEKQPGSILLPVESCPDRTTLFYHIDIMEQADLINRKPGGYGGYPVCRLTWHGNDVLNTIQQDGVLETVEATHGKKWKTWSLNIINTTFTQIAQKLILQALT